MPHEVACVDLTPFNYARASSALNNSSNLSLFGSRTNGPAEFNFPDEYQPYLVAVGLWLGHGLVLLRLPDLELLYEEPLPETTASTGTALLPRSILMTQLEDIAYLFVAMGDGTLYFYTIDLSGGWYKFLKFYFVYN